MRLKRTKKNQARAGWARRLVLVRATSLAEVDFIGVQRCYKSPGQSFHHNTTLSARSLPLIILDNCPHNTASFQIVVFFQEPMGAFGYRISPDISRNPIFK